jgi:hypothetical protein
MAAGTHPIPLLANCNAEFSLSLFEEQRSEELKSLTSLINYYTTFSTRMMKKEEESLKLYRMTLKQCAKYMPYSCTCSSQRNELQESKLQSQIRFISSCAVHVHGGDVLACVHISLLPFNSCPLRYASP